MIRANGYDTHFDQSAGEVVAVPRLVPVANIFMPNAECALMAFFGLVLSSVGLIISHRRRTCSLLSLLGFILICISMLAFVFPNLFMTFL